MVDGSKCNTDDGLKDPYVGVPLPPNNAEGASQGTHLYRIDNPGATVTNTVNMNIDCTWHTASFEFDTNFGNSISVCLLNNLDPFPDEITKTDPVVFYHGTDRDTADDMVAGLALEARGSADFGKGFYTATNVGGTSPRGFSGTGLLLAENTGWRRVRNLQKKKPDGSLDLRWGVVELDIPLTTMLDFLCDYQDFIVGFKDTSTSAPPPWNALPSPGRNSPYDNNPIPVAEGDPMNWFNFAWFNWYAYRCMTSRPFTNDEGTDNYVPDWEPDDFNLLPDWGMALIWGRLYAPASSCTGAPGRTMPAGAEYDSRNGGYGLNQYVWGSGGLDFLNTNPSIVRKLATSGETNPNP